MDFPITAEQIAVAVEAVSDRLGCADEWVRRYNGCILSMTIPTLIVGIGDGTIAIKPTVGGACFIDLTGTVPVFRPCTGHAVCACHFARELWGVISQIDNGLDIWEVADHLQDSLQVYSLERLNWGEGNYVLRSPHGREDDVEVGIGDEFIAIGDDVIPLSISLLSEYLENHGY